MQLNETRIDARKEIGSDEDEQDTAGGHGQSRDDGRENPPPQICRQAATHRSCGNDRTVRLAGCWDFLKNRESRQACVDLYSAHVMDWLPRAGKSRISAYATMIRGARR